MQSFTNVLQKMIQYQHDELLLSKIFRLDCWKKSFKADVDLEISRLLILSEYYLTVLKQTIRDKRE